LKRGLESFFGRPLSGNFEMFFAMTRALFSPLTVHSLTPATIEARGAAVLAQMRWSNPVEDATLMLVACLEGRQAEGKDLLGSWVESNPSDRGEMIDAVTQMVTTSDS
jgi:hypothetical protein